VFPILAEEGILDGFEVNGLWEDIGVPEDYLRANNLLLAKLDGVQVDEGSKVDRSAETFSPSSLAHANGG
jgi:NDP-sugar pyrophosphorylase family protein